MKDPVIKNTEGLLISGQPPGLTFNVRLVEVNEKAPFKDMSIQNKGSNPGGNGCSTR